MANAIFAPARAFLLLAGLLVILLSASSGARAQSCNEDLATFGKKRNSEIEALNGISKSHGGKLDPIAACPHFRNMSSIEGQMLAYLQKNQEWCYIPDDFINGFKGNSEKTVGMAKQACELAAKAKKMQEQGGGFAGGGNLPPPPKLPAGPL